MSYSTPSFIQGVKAGADLSGKEGLAVKISADNTVVVASGASDVVVGVLHSGNVSGKSVEVSSFGHQGEVVSGAAISAGQELAINAAGKMIPAVSTNIVRAIAKTSASASDQYVDVIFMSYTKA